MRAVRLCWGGGGGAGAGASWVMRPAPQTPAGRDTRATQLSVKRTPNCVTSPDRRRHRSSSAVLNTQRIIIIIHNSY